MASIRKFFKRDPASREVKAGPGTAQALIKQGVAAEGAGRAQEALLCYRKAIEADPRYAPAHMNLGIALHAAGDLASALASHQQAIALDPGHAFYEAAASLGDKLGPVLYQLPPFAKKDAPKLAEFVRRLPKDGRAAFEFRHASWFDDEIYSILRDADAALCAADTDEVEDPDTVLVPTASWGYLRLRRTEYGEGDLGKWAARVQKQTWSESFVFFKHEDEGKGPKFAHQFLELL